MYNHAAAITPSDTVNLSAPTRAIFCGGAGNIAFVSEAGDAAVTLTGCLAGHVYHIAAMRVNATNTTATNLVALW